MRERANALGIKVDGRWSEHRLLEEIMKTESKMIEKPIINTTEAADKPTIEWANTRAAAIWEGQSSSLSILERVGRIKLALKAKGFEDFSNITIPTKIEYKKYL